MHGHTPKAACVLALGLVLLFFARGVERSGWAGGGRGQEFPSHDLRSRIKSTSRAHEASWPETPFDRWSNSTTRIERVGALRREQLKRYYEARSRCTNWQPWKAAEFRAEDKAMFDRAIEEQGGEREYAQYSEYIKARMAGYEPLLEDYKDENLPLNFGYLFANGAEYFAKHDKPQDNFVFNEPTILDVPIEVCIDPNQDATEGIMFYRFGPMVGRGGYDWHHFGAFPLPLHPNANFVTGKMMAPVNADGMVLGYPPIHVHHAHVTHRGVLHWLDSHGDSICGPGWGGEACYLRHLPEEYGFYVNKTDGLCLEILLNDVREYPAPDMPFYFEIGLYWKAKVKKRAAMANLTLAKYFGDVNGVHYFQTQAMSQKRGVVWAYGRWPTKGRVLRNPDQNIPWLHAHRTLFDQLWAFAATPEELGLSPSLLQILQEGPTTPVVIRRQDQAWYPSDVEFTALINHLENHPKLRCWIRSGDISNLEYVDGSPGGADMTSDDPSQVRWKKNWYDRLGQIDCKEWMFGRGEAWTFVGVNGEQIAGMYDKLVSLQHNEIRLWYESFEDPDPPTHEAYGAHTSDAKGPSQSFLLMDNCWNPPLDGAVNVVAFVFRILGKLKSRISGGGILADEGKEIYFQEGGRKGEARSDRDKRLDQAMQGLYPESNPASASYQHPSTIAYFPKFFMRMTQMQYRLSKSGMRTMHFNNIAQDPNAKED